jgi:tetratricopeptide (TPR) repeat protein
MPADRAALNRLRPAGVPTRFTRLRSTQTRAGWAVLWLCLIAAGSARDAHAGLAADEAADYENRIEFAYFSGDVRELGALVRSLTGRIAEDGAGRSLDYLAAHASYRLAQVLADTGKSGAESAAKACLASLRELAGKDTKDAETFAQQAACHALLAHISVVGSVTHGPAAADAADAAIALGPRNPRVYLAGALVDYWRPARLGGDRARAFSRLLQAAQLFEAQAPGSSAFPSWGNADVYLWLGRAYIERRDLAAARSALEQALIIAPDFAAARRELSRLSAH